MISIGIVEKEFPYKGGSSQKTIYKLADTMFHFWYRFIPSNHALITMGAVDRVYQRIKQQFCFRKVDLQLEKQIGDVLLLSFDEMEWD